MIINNILHTAMIHPIIDMIIAAFIIDEWAVLFNLNAIIKLISPTIRPIMAYVHASNTDTMAKTNKIIFVTLFPEFISTPFMQGALAFIRNVMHFLFLTPYFLTYKIISAQYAQAIMT